MKNKFKRNEMSKVCFDFTGLKGNKIKRVSKNVLIGVGYLLAGATILFLLYTFYIIAWALM